MRSCLFPLIAVLVLAGASSASAATASRFGSYLGGNPIETQPSPTAVGLTKVAAVDVSNSSSYVLKTDGSIWAFGDGAGGRLGDGTNEGSPTPVRVMLPEGTVAVRLGEAKDTGYAVTSTGHVFTWGADAGGVGCVPGVKHTTPVEIPNLSGVVEVQGGGEHVLLLKSDGTVLGCGVNHQGQLGLPENEGRLATPTVIPGLESIIQISAGDKTSEALDSAGRIFMAGENRQGEVGIGSEAQDVFKMTEVPLGEAATSISDGGDLQGNGTAFAVTERTVWGWGDDKQGQLGNGTTESAFKPVDTGLHFASIASGGAFVLGLDEEGNVYSWGSNSGGDLGIGTKGGKSTTPVFVESGVSAISATARNALDVHRRKP